MVFYLSDHFHNFVNFPLINTLDISELLFWCHDNAGNRAEAIRLEFGNISSIDPVLL